MDKKYDYLKYTPTLPGKIAIGIATPSAIIGIIAVFFAFKFPEAFIITLIAEAIAVIGGIVLTIDIVRFNISQKKKQDKIQSKSKNKENTPKEMDIMRIVHMIIGIIAGIIIGYLLTCLIRFDDNARRIIIRPILLLETECTCIFITIISHQLIL